MAKILVVDDDTSICRIVMTILKKHDVESADGLKSARERLTENNYHAIVLDLNLGDGSAEQLIDEGLVPVETGVVVISATNNPEERARSILGEREHYVLRKPFNVKSLTKAVDKALLHNAVGSITSGHKFGTETKIMLKDVQEKLDQMT